MNTQVVLITGGLTGIGRATALAFAKQGAQVVVSGRRDEEGKKLVAELRKLGAEAEFVRSDTEALQQPATPISVVDLSKGEAAVRQALSDFGMEPEVAAEHAKAISNLIERTLCPTK